MYLPDYGSGANGGFREIDDLVDRDGEATHPVRLAFDEKLDYIFFTRSLRWGGGDGTDSRRSDHRVLVGSLTIP
jgi:hypothetical protein